MKRVKEIRVERGLSQSKLAEKTGLGQATISLLESGHHDPNLGTLNKIAAALDVPVIAFFEKTEPPKEEAPEQRLKGSLRTLLDSEKRSLFLAGIAVNTDLWIAGTSQADIAWLKNFATEHDASPRKVIDAMHEEWPELQELQRKYEDRARIEAQEISEEVSTALGA